ncbi:methyl-accepting chemotaxis protein [Chromobacterium haemolyticum]|nr:methyl-accepting chemotaxis protein [Chromobacterium haemolyticum]
MRKFSDWPIWLKLTMAVWCCLVLAWSGLIAWETSVSRDIAVEQAQDLAHSMNEMTMAGLTGMMITGTVGQRDVFLDQIKKLSAVRDLRVIRGPAVSKQFGPGNAGDKSLSGDTVEQQALRDGKPHIQIESTPALGEHLRVVYPALASRNYLGKNCMMCHQVADKTPLGVVSMRISLEKPYASVSRFRDQSILFAILASLPLMAVVFLLARRLVTRPLQAMSTGLAELAQGEGDLTRRLPVRSRDEIGDTAQRFNQMLAAIAELVRHVGASAGAVSQSSRQLADGAAHLAESSHRQNRQSQSAADAVEQLASHIGEIAGKAEDVSAEADQSLQRSEDGRSSLCQLQREISQVEQAVRLMAQAETELASSTSSITNMTKEVREIAEQTNLLALNAAIEAARAGEQGRGFAVVADEVRKLAEKSARSASEIDAVTGALNQKTDAVRAAVNAGLSSLTASRQSADSVSSVLDAANQSVAEVRQGLRQIVAVTEQQRAASQSVTGSIDAIAEMAQTNDQEIGQTVNAAEQLEQLAQRLTESVSRFTV